MAKVATSSSTARTYQPFDTTTRTYKVLMPVEGLPAVDKTFTAYPMGTVFWQIDGYAPKHVIEVDLLNGWIDGKKVELIAPANLVGKEPPKKPQEA